MKKKICLILSLILIINSSIISFAGTWKWMNPNKDSVSECYYIEEDDSVFKNGMTPDGYEVDHNGAWIKNGNVITTPVAIIDQSSMDEMLYPLKGKVEKYLIKERSTGNVYWYNDKEYIRKYCKTIDEEKEENMKCDFAISKKDSNCLLNPEKINVKVLADLAGYEELKKDDIEAIKLKEEVLNFLNSFDSDSASDFVKATKICDYIYNASYDKEKINRNASSSYGCLVDKICENSGYASAAELLGLAVGLPVLKYRYKK